MDPITALSLSANVLQIIDFGVSIVKHTKLVLNTGADPEHEYLSAIATDLQAVLATLLTQHASNTTLVANQGASLALCQLVKQCQEEAKAMVTTIQYNKPPNSIGTGLTRHFSVFRTVIKAYWNKSEIEALEKRLGGYRAQLSIRLLAALNEKVDKQGSDIVEVLSLARAVNSSVQAVSAVLKSRDRSLRTITNDSREFRSGEIPYTITYRAIEPALDPAVQAESNHDGPAPILASLTEVSFRDVAQKILDALWFRLVPSRERGIDEAFDKTFAWIFAPEGSGTTTWSHFPTWLEHGRACYWINGKAGSGKSTLMKYIGNHPELKRSLKLWAGECDLLIATFFFWRAGQDIQKSQEGLLRSLLFQLLDRRRELLTVCFPELCRALGEKDGYMQDCAISPDDLRLAFSRLLKHKLPKTKIFFLIDGLDEYRGDYRSLSDLVLQATQSDMIKVLVSSRPLPLLVQAFGNYSSLKVQDLTINDIMHYTTQKLASDSALCQLDVLHPGFSKQLIDSIASKASGVFLWVVLVTGRVLEGLANYDTKDGLLHALEGLPVDLEQLYAYMFGTMTATYREEASLMMQLYVRSETVQFHYPMTALQLSYAESKGTENCFDNTVEVLTPDQMNALCNRIEGRLRSRCCGLLEVQRSTWSTADRKLYVGFLHRTVMDFFERDEIWNCVLSWNSVSRDCLDEILLCSSIREIRQDLPATMTPAAQPTQRPLAMNTPDVGTRILHGILYCGTLYRTRNRLVEPYVTELWKLYRSLPNQRLRAQIDKWAVARTLHTVLDVPATEFCQPILMFAAAYGLGESSELMRQEMCNKGPQCCSLMLVNLLLNLNNLPNDKTAEQVTAGVISLLKRNIDPNSPSIFYPPIDTANTSEEIKSTVRLSPNQHGDLVPWIYWLSCKRRNAYMVVHHPILYMTILERMMDKGATLQARLGGVNGRKSDTIASAVEDCLGMLPLSGSLEATELRRRIQTHLKQGGVPLSRTKSESDSSHTSTWMTRFRTSRRSTHR